MRKMAKAATIAAMAILLAGCRTATGGIGEETLPMETESLQDKTEETESTTECESGAEAATETRTQPGQQESGMAEPPERETKTASTAAKAAEETAGGNGSTGKTDKEASASSANGEDAVQEEQQPETETQARQEPEKSAEPAPQPAPADSPETQPEPEASQEEPEPAQPAPPEQEPAPQPEPEPEPAPQPEPEPAETQAKTCYDYPFDTGAIRSELIAIGQGAGLTHVEKTPDQSSWAMPVTASENFQGEALKRALADYVSSMPVMVETYGGNPLTEFCIYVENVGNDSYTFYFLY